MSNNIYDRIRNNLLTAAIYTFVLAWDEIIKEKQQHINKEKQQPPSENTQQPINKDPQQQTNPSCSDEIPPSRVIARSQRDKKDQCETLPAIFWEKDNLSIDEMMREARRFLTENLKFASDGSVLPHRFSKITRKNDRPIQMDIIEYFKATKFIKDVYEEVSIQSSVSRELQYLTGSKDPNNKSIPKTHGVLICVNRKYVPYSLADKRKKIIADFKKYARATNEEGVRLFADLDRDYVYNLGNGGVVIFFKEHVNLTATIAFLKDFIGEDQTCDIFDVKSRLFILLDGLKKEQEEAMNDLAELVYAVYTEQHKLEMKPLKKI
jgi:hypothetical protein